jgi:hypothetical protein
MLKREHRHRSSTWMSYHDLSKAVTRGSKTAIGAGWAMVGAAGTTSSLLPAWLTAIIGLTGWATSAAGAMFAFAQIISAARRMLSDELSRQGILLLRLADYRVRIGAPADVPQAVALLNDVFGPDHITAEFIAGKLAACPDALTLVTRGNATPAGCFLIYGLNGRARSRIMDGSIVNGYHLGPDELVGPGGSPSALYIGTVGAHADGFDRAATLLMLRDVVRDHLRRCDTIETVFARPNTRHGNRLAAGVGFSPIEQDGSQIWALRSTRVPV